MFPFRISIATVIPYFVFLVIVYLSGVYFGGRLLYLFLLFLLLPIFSFLHVIVTTASIRFNQSFSNDHPVKGQEVVYRVSVALEAGLPGSLTKIHFKRIGGEISDSLQDVSFVPGPQRPFRREYPIRCRFRGVYTVGMENLEVTDLLGWFTIRIPVWHRTFYVLPRLVPLQQLKLDAAGDVTKTSGTEAGEAIDYTLTKTLTEYRPNANIKHIAWKKFAATGEPFLKMYEQTSWPGITIYLDTRRLRKVSYNLLEAEDCSVEILVALINYFVARNVPVYLRTGQWGHTFFPQGSKRSVQKFIQDTVNLYFREDKPGGISPAELFQMDIESNDLYTGHVLFISHIFDSESTSFFFGSHPAGIKVSGIFNLTALPEGEKKKINYFAESVNEKESRVFLVSNPESIREDLS